MHNTLQRSCAQQQIAVGSQVEQALSARPDLLPKSYLEAQLRDPLHIHMPKQL